MPIDPRISLGVQPIQVADPIARYGQLATIQNAQNQNALAQYQLGTAKREEETLNALNEAYAKSYDPATGKINRNTLRESLARGGFGSKLPGIEKTLLELDKEELLRQKTQGEVSAQTVDLLDKKLKQSRAFLDTLDPADPNAPAAYLRWHEANHADPIIGPALKARGVTAEQSRAQIQAAVAKGPQAFADLINGSKLGTEKFMELNKPVTFTQDLGPTSRVMERGGLGGPVTMVPGSEFTKGKTFSDLAAERQANLSLSRLAFDERKFAWEKANPGYTIQQAEDGSIVGVNNRSLQAFPVTLGGTSPPPAAPFAGGGAPAPGGAGKRGGAVAPAAEPIIQPRGEPLKGKGTALTESQGNATAFGLRMKESHAALKDLESKGETGTGVIRGTVGGVVGLVPFVGDKFTAATDDIFNVLPSILGGMSPEQQQVVNGRINFITAVLRKESGAAISPGEFVTAEKLYFPKPGDDATVIKQKQRARELAIKAMEIQAGPGAKSIQGLTPSTSGATSASDPLGLFNK
jgi:hypothetical protein